MIEPQKVTKKDPTNSGKRIWSGKWEQLVCLGKDPETGKSRWRSQTFSTKDECKQWAAKMEVDKGEGTLRPTLSKLTFVEYVRDVWLPVYETQVRNTYGIEKTLMKWLDHPPAGVPLIGKKPLHKLAVGDFDRFYLALAELGMAGCGIENVHALVKRSLKHAVRSGQLPRNPADFATRPKPEVKAIIESEADEEEGAVVQSLSREQAVRFLAAANQDRLAPLWHLLLDTALRPGECFALSWRHIDWKHKVVKVRGTLGRVRGKKRKALGKSWQITKPKTKASVGDVPLSDTTLWLLRKWQTTQAEERAFAKKHGLPWEDHGFVFTTQYGGPLGNNSWRWWTRIMRETDAGKGDLGAWTTDAESRGKTFTPSLSMYCLRHTRLTLLYEDTHDIVRVSRFARHANVGITTKFYVHTKAEHTADVARESFAKLVASVG